MSKKTQKLTKKYLIEQYIIQNKTMKQISQMTGLNVKTVSKKIKEYKIEKSSKDIYESSLTQILKDVKNRYAVIDKPKRKKYAQFLIRRYNLPYDINSINQYSFSESLFNDFCQEIESKSLEYDIAHRMIIDPIRNYNYLFLPTLFISELFTSSLNSIIDFDRPYLFFTDNEISNIRSRNKAISNIKNKLHENLFKISAKKCIVKEINTQEKNLFLDLYDFGGPDKSSIKLGLFYCEELVAVMTFSKFLRGYDWKLSRFCVKEDYTIYGAPSKLFNYFKNKYLKKDEIVAAYSDKSKYSGAMFPKLGFTFLKTIDSEFNWYKEPNIISNMNQKFMHIYGYIKIYNAPKDIYLFTKKE